MIAAILLICLAMAGCGEIGRSFDSRADYLAYQKEEGYVFLGRFGDAWPAKIVSVVRQLGSIEFQLANGTHHTYPGYDGYELKLVRLRGQGGEEIVMVLRSAELILYEDPLSE